MQNIISKRLHAEDNWVLEDIRCYVDLHKTDISKLSALKRPQDVKQIQNDLVDNGLF